MPPSSERRQYYTSHQQDYLIHPNPNRYVLNKLPHLDEKGRLIFDRAPALKRQYSSQLWEAENRLIGIEGVNRKDYQIVVIPDHRDVNAVLLHDLIHRQLGPYSPATVITDNKFPDNSEDNRLFGMMHPESAYLVSSVYNNDDLARIIRTADLLKTIYGVKLITLISSFFYSGRQDKNIDKNGYFKTNPIDINANMKALSGLIDRAIINETHSSAIQFFADQLNIPLAAVSYMNVLLGNVLNRKIRLVSGTKEQKVFIKPENLVVLGPDIGRNLASIRLSKFINSPLISFSKKRDGGENVFFEQLSTQQKNLLKGRIGLMFDDIGSTLSTANRVANMGYENGLIGIIMMLGHLELANGWKNNIEFSFPNAIITTDSRDPIGNYQYANNITRVSVAPFLKEIIKADVEGINFWEDNAWKRLILQPLPGEIPE